LPGSGTPIAGDPPNGGHIGTGADVIGSAGFAGAGGVALAAGVGAGAELSSCIPVATPETGAAPLAAAGVAAHAHALKP
jgi:hypothetical protein